MTNLWPHQKQALDKAGSQTRFAFFMDMGTGKTKTVIEWLNTRLPVPDNTLIVCPKEVMDVWPEELAKHHAWPWVALVLDSGTSTKKAERLLNTVQSLGRNDPPLFVIVNYESVWRGKLAAAIRQAGFGAVVLDESHRAKSPGSKVSKFLGHLGKHTHYRALLTGTPMPHSPLDIYAQFRFLDPSIFGTRYNRFRERYAVMGGYEGREVIAFRNLDELTEKVNKVSFRVELDEAVSLPEGVNEVRYAVLEPSAKTVYKKLEKEFVAEVDSGIVTASNALVKLLRLHQMTGGLLQLDDGSERVVSTAKRALLEDTLGDIGKDEPVVIFGLYRHDLEEARVVAARLGRPVYELSGTRKELAAWKAETAPGAVLVVQLATGGLGIDLTRARYVVYYSIGFSLGNYLQSRARVRRPGQTRPTVFIHLLLRGTVDMRIMHAIQEKRQIVEGVLEGIHKE